MLTINIHNIHQKNNIADYIYKVYINDELIENGIYKSHDRKDGWAKLIYDIAELHLKEDSMGGE